MRENIYIRKYNEDTWNKLESKSGFVNEMLEEQFGKVPIAEVVAREQSPRAKKAVKRAVVASIADQNASTPIIPKTVTEVKKQVGRNLCPHGSEYGKCVEPRCLTAYRMGTR